MKKETDVPGRHVYKPLGSDQVLPSPQNQSRQTSAYKVPIPMLSSWNLGAIRDASGPQPETFNFQAPPDGFQRQLTDLGKQYTDNNNKFGGQLYDILSIKLLIFYDYCSKVGVKEDQYHNAYSSMLKD
ncbi:Bgt-4522-2 [Blumeria graminis f. sp. tritici]|uniref:Uncharacterized protein n=3 Tax=Blumeria graminis f. sp. tritici TaxID=62690 RepID=A0A656KQZ3_BLUGR|nr:hypothetical protein BGT96224_4522B [Blumeria graminis f. sp. tritici 96224]VDB87949.1 Bgt-4522-2 [Blumeria graminis f. sp. tritici]